MPVSETEKRGISSGCCFSDKAGHVPIKKRRFVLRSPSPPPAENSPCIVETADQSRSQDASNKLVPLQSSSSRSQDDVSKTVDTNNSIGSKKSDESSKKLCDDEAFCGISILAAAACSSSLGKYCGFAEDNSGIEESSVLERAHEVSTNTETCPSTKALPMDDIFNSSKMSSGATSSCISVEPTSLFTIVNCSQNVATVGNGLKDASCGVDSLSTSCNVSCGKDEEIVRSQKPSFRDDRFHWDLNVGTDAWEQPFDDPCVQSDFAHSISEDVGISNHNDNMKSEGHDLRDDKKTVCAAQSYLLPGEPRESVNQTTGEVKDKHDVDAGSSLKQSLCLGEKSLSSRSSISLDVTKCMVEDTNSGHQDESVDPTDKFIVAPQLSALCTLNETEDASAKILDLNENCIEYQPVVEGLKSNVGVSSFQFQNLTTFDVVAADNQITSCVSSNSDTVKEVKQNVAVPGLLESSKNSNREGKSFLEGIQLKTVDHQEHPDYDLPERFDVADAAYDLQEDYDSQYEDGELRESSGRAWEEYDAIDREVENADYVSNCRETLVSNPIDFHVSSPRQVEDTKSERLAIAPSVSSHEHIVDNEVCMKVDEAAGNEMEETESNNQTKSSHVFETTETKNGGELLENCKSFSEVATPGVDDNGKNSKMPVYNDGFLDSRSTKTRGLQSQITTPVARDGQLKKIENRFEPGPMRSFDRLKYSFHYQGRGRQGGNWDGSLNSRRGMRRCYSPIIHRHSKLDDDAIVEKDDFGCAGTQDDVSYSQQLVPKNRVGADGEPCGSFHSRYQSDRNFSPDRAGGFGRGRPFRHRNFGEGRGGRGRFNGPFSNESFQSPLIYRRSLSRRERSISPFGGRGLSNFHHSRRFSPSRSRSRSPVVRNSPMRRVGAGSGSNAFLGQRSRSPNFRTEGRMQRPRSPYQQPGIGAGYAGGFRSISRNHGSPPRNRWNSVSKDEQVQYREPGYKQRTSFLDRSPGRIRLRDDRSNGIGSSRNMKPDGYCRISDRVPDDDDRGRYEENFQEKRKQHHFFRPGRHNYDDGMASRLCQDNNDSFTMGNGFRDRDASSFPDSSRGLRGNDSRIGDAPRRFRGESHSFIRDGKFNRSSKQFGVDGMDSPHNLKSEEHYRPNYTGRFSTINGANRGRRYDDFTNRRKQYGQTNIMRRGDTEDTYEIT